MVEFIIRLNNALTTPHFSLNDLPGAGRMDIACRCVTNSIFISFSLRDNVKTYINLNGPPNPPVTILFDTKNLKNVYPDERNIASHIKIALSKKIEENFIESEPGIYVSKKSFESLVKEAFDENKKIFYMHKDGYIDIRDLEFDENYVFIIGDHKGIPQKTEKFIEKYITAKVSVGKVEYLASQIITIIHYEADRKKEKIKNS